MLSYIGILERWIFWLRNVRFTNNILGKYKYVYKHQTKGLTCFITSVGDSLLFSTMFLALIVIQGRTYLLCTYNRFDNIKICKNTVYLFIPFSKPSYTLFFSRLSKYWSRPIINQWKYLKFEYFFYWTNRKP